MASLVLQFSQRTACSLLPFASVVSRRCLSTSVSCLMKRPVFNGPEYPKRPPSAYMLFTSEKRGTMPTVGENPQTVVRKLGELWKGLTSFEKQVYEDRYAKLKEEHKVEVAMFLKGLGDEKEQKKYLKSLADYRQKRRKYIKHYRLKKLNLVKPHPLNSYSMFIKEHAKDFIGQGRDIKEGMRALADKWKGLSKEEKDVYATNATVASAKKLAEYQENYRKALREGLIEPIKEEKPKKKTAPKKRTAKKKTIKKKPAPVKPVRKNQ